MRICLYWFQTAAGDVRSCSSTVVRVGPYGDVGLTGGHFYLAAIAFVRLRGASRALGELAELPA